MTCPHPPERSIYLDVDTVECLACGHVWGECEHDNGVETVGDYEVCEMCGECLEPRACEPI